MAKPNMEHNRIEEEIENAIQWSKPIPVEQFNDLAFMNRNLDDEEPSFGGHGTLETLQVTKLLEGAGITCCIVGISALIYYGAARGRRVSSE